MLPIGPVFCNYLGMTAAGLEIAKGDAQAASGIFTVFTILKEEEEEEEDL